MASVRRPVPDEAGAVKVSSTEDLRDVVLDLPLGFLGSATATPTCTFAEFSSHVGGGVSGCPTDTIVGHIKTEPESIGRVSGPLYNLSPERGVAAEFGFVDALAAPHVIYANVVPTASGYVLRTIATQLPQITFTDFEATIYGDPASKDQSGSPPSAMLTNPSVCNEEALVTTVHVDSWQHPGRMNANGTPDFSDPRWIAAQSVSPPVTECNLLRFNPEAFAFQPEAHSADSATGASFDLTIPQTEEPLGLATPPLRNARVTLPAGMIVNPAAAGGLAACSQSQIGWLGGSASNFTADAPVCPDASDIGSVEVTTPLLSKSLVGTIYLASEYDNPFGSRLAAYVVIDDPTTVILVKIAGRLDLDKDTGQITGIFDENPQLPFSDLKLKFFGGSRGELATPETCGHLTTTAHSNHGRPTAPLRRGQPSSPLSPSTRAARPGSTRRSPRAPFAAGGGVLSPFVACRSHATIPNRRFPDSPSRCRRACSRSSPGLSRCSDSLLAEAATNPSAAAEKASPSCPAASQLGTVEAGAGAGEPLFLPGKAYLPVPYKGAPYGLAVVVPAAAGRSTSATSCPLPAQDRAGRRHATAVLRPPFPTIIDANGADGHRDGFPSRRAASTSPSTARGSP